MLYQVSKKLINILACRESPEGLPYSYAALAGVLILNFTWRFLGVFSYFGFFWGTMLAGIPIAVMAGLLFLLLQKRQQEARWLKLLMAFEGVIVALGMIVWCIALPLINTPLHPLPFLMGTFWQIVVMGHILQHGIEVSKNKGVLMAVGLMLAVFIVCVPILVLLGGMFNIPLPE